MSAEQSFREAFERLKNGAPQSLKKGTPVTQNNIAREAGCDPSALRKSRYPQLIREIQEWVLRNSEVNPEVSAQQTVRAQKGKNRSLRARLEDQKMSLDHALALLIEADAKILELAMDVERLRAQLPKDNVLPMIRDL